MFILAITIFFSLFGIYHGIYDMAFVFAMISGVIIYGSTTGVNYFPEAKAKSKGTFVNDLGELILSLFKIPFAILEGLVKML